MNGFRGFSVDRPPAVTVLLVAVVLALVAAAPAEAHSYGWLGGNGQWSIYTSWGSFTCTSSTCYPQTADDDALISDHTNVTVTLTESLEIDDLTLNITGLETSLSFTGGGTSYTISPDAIIITGNPVTMTGRAGIVTHDDEACEEE